MHPGRQKQNEQAAEKLGPPAFQTYCPVLGLMYQDTVTLNPPQDSLFQTAKWYLWPVDLGSRDLAKQSDHQEAGAFHQKVKETWGPGGGR